MHALGALAIAAVVFAGTRHRWTPEPRVEKEVPAVVEKRRWTRMITIDKRHVPEGRYTTDDFRVLEATREDGTPPPWPEADPGPDEEVKSREERIYILFRDELDSTYMATVDSARFVSVREGQPVLLRTAGIFHDVAAFREVTPEAVEGGARSP